MIGAIDVGGGTRGIFGAGVLDHCIDKDIHFDHFIGVSAGSANGASYLAGQKGRNYQFYNDYAFRKEYMGLSNYLRTKSFINLDYIYSTLSNQGGENPLDYQKMMDNPANFEIVATDAQSGKPVYFQKKNIQDDKYDFLKASCCVPGINRPYPVNGRLFFDGGLSDPIPYQRAFDAGCDKVVVILTRPKNDFRSGTKDHWMSKIIRKKYPNAALAWENRCETYNTELSAVLELEKQGRVLIVAPDSIGELKTLSQDHEQLDALYRKGYREAEKIQAFIG